MLLQSTHGVLFLLLITCKCVLIWLTLCTYDSCRFYLFQVMNGASRERMCVRSERESPASDFVVPDGKRKDFTGGNDVTKRQRRRQRLLHDAECSWRWRSTPPKNQITRWTSARSHAARTTDKVVVGSSGISASARRNRSRRWPPWTLVDGRSKQINESRPSSCRVPTRT